MKQYDMEQFIEDLYEEALRLGLDDEADIDNYITQKQIELGV
tara:strand:+ start:2639 stop:2764 length:126 start_codon:yes stop_codon:yes gene_type:complete